MDQRAALWADIDVRGYFKNSEKWKYFFQHQTRIDTDTQVFETAFIRGAIEYLIKPTMSVWLGYDFRGLMNNTNNRLEYEQRVWEQFLIFVINTDNLILALRSRFEQRDDLNERGTALQWRQMISIKLRKKIRNRITPIIFDEMFFNLNHPVWVSNDTLSQNRVFIGIIIPNKRKTLTCSIGYINQLILTQPRNIMSHNLFIGFHFR